MDDADTPTVLGVFAHLDDAEIWMGGTICKHRAREGAVTTLVFASNTDPRIEESQKAHGYVGAELIVEKKGNEVSTITSVIEERKPQILVTHWWDDCHPEHRGIFEQTYQALIMPWIKLDVPKRLYVVDTYNSIGLRGPFNPTTYVDISEFWDSKTALIGFFRSQPFKIWQDMIKVQNALHGKRTRVDYSEGFIECPIQGHLGCFDELPV